MAKHTRPTATDRSAGAQSNGRARMIEWALLVRIMTQRDPSAAAGTPEYINLSPGSSRRRLTLSRCLSELLSPSLSLSLCLIPYRSHSHTPTTTRRPLSLRRDGTHDSEDGSRDVHAQQSTHSWKKKKKKILRVTQILTHAFSYEFVNSYLYQRRRRCRSPGLYYYAMVHPTAAAAAATQ